MKWCAKVSGQRKVHVQGGLAKHRPVTEHISRSTCWHVPTPTHTYAHIHARVHTSIHKRVQIKLLLKLSAQCKFFDNNMHTEEGGTGL